MGQKELSTIHQQQYSNNFLKKIIMTESQVSYLNKDHKDFSNR